MSDGLWKDLWERHTTVNSRCEQERRGTAVAIPPCLPLGSCRYCQRAPQHQMVYDGRKGKHPAHPGGALSAAASTSAPQSSGSPRSLPRMCFSADSRHRRDGGWCAHPWRWSARSCIGPQSGSLAARAERGQRRRYHRPCPRSGLTHGCPGMASAIARAASRLAVSVACITRVSTTKP